MSDNRIHKLVLDQSTSGTKLLLVGIEENEAKILRRMDRKHTQIFPQDGWVEHDPSEIVKNTKQLIAEMLEATNLSAQDIRSLSITNQRETIVAWNKKTGQPVSNALVWQCNRSNDICKQLIEAGKETEIQRKTGLKIDSYFSGPKIRWLFENSDEMRSLAASGELAIGTMDSWLIWNLTDGEVFATEPSNASRTLLYNIYENTWDSALCDIFLVPPDSLAEIRDSNDSFGHYEGIPIQGVMADSQAALYGQNCLGFGDIKVTMGTGCSVMMQIEERSDLISDNILKTIAFTDNGATDYALEGIIRSCGDTLTWLSSELALFGTIEEGIESAFSVNNNEGVYLVPAQLGLAAPFWDSDIRAAFLGMNRRTGKPHLIRAGFESILFQIRAVIDEIKQVTCLDIPRVKVDGGVTKNNRLMQMLADILGITIEVSCIEELSALGVLMLTSGFDMQKEGKIFNPKSNNLEPHYQQWLEYINKVRDK